MAWHVIRVRSKDAQKQLARTSLKLCEEKRGKLNFSIYWFLLVGEAYVKIYPRLINFMFIRIVVGTLSDDFEVNTMSLMRTSRTLKDTYVVRILNRKVR